MTADSTGRNAPPFAIRVVRPYLDESELFAAESGAFTKAGVVLVGAPSRPVGVSLRFEMVLADGTSLLRGEGRVVDYRPPLSGDEGALAIRFTRLDLRSKDMLDRALAHRERNAARAHSIAPPAWSETTQTPRPSSLPPAIVDRLSQRPMSPLAPRPSTMPPPLPMSALAAPRMPRVSSPPPPSVRRASFVPPPMPEPADEEAEEVHDHELTEATGEIRMMSIADARATELSGAALSDARGRLRHRSPQVDGITAELRRGALDRLRVRVHA